MSSSSEDDSSDLQVTKDFLSASESAKSFKELGICDVLCEACTELGWSTPTHIQVKTIPPALEGRDIIGLAETGSGKSGAFILPILQDILQCRRKLFALILTPTRELAFQISEQFNALGISIGLVVAVIVGGVDMTTQSISLAKRPHVVVATPGRMADHLQHTKGFNLKSIKYLVLDEADRILNMDFEKEVDLILQNVPTDRRTFLFSATMTKKVQKLERASVKNPVRLEVSSRYQTVQSLVQYMCLVPNIFKETYLVFLLNEHSAASTIVFTATCQNTLRLAIILRTLNMTAIPLNGQLSQTKRLYCLNEFKAKTRSVLIATDVASRGLDIPHVDLIINYDVPLNPKDYIHRVGRTARAGRSGKALTIVTQYDVEAYMKVESAIKQKLEPYPIVKEEVMALNDTVVEAKHMANIKLKAIEAKRKGKASFESKRRIGDYDQNDDESITLLKKRKFLPNQRRKPVSGNVRRKGRSK
ncbi:hypothetical protein ACOME3_007322 [Neoechinorhynchus agilis]